MDENLLEELKAKFEEIRKLLTPESIQSLTDEELENLKDMYSAFSFLLAQSDKTLDIDENDEDSDIES